MMFHRFNPDIVDEVYTSNLFVGIGDIPAHAAELLQQDGWRFYAVNAVRGYCFYTARILTIPTWAMRKGYDYKTWYICHEMAHAITGPQHQAHGDTFMQTLMQICPARCLHYELGYKPREARRNGIRKPRSVSEINAKGAL